MLISPQSIQSFFSCYLIPQEGRGTRDVLLLLIMKMLVMTLTAVFGVELCALHSLAHLSLTIIIS